MKYHSVILSAATVYAAVIPSDASQQDIEPVKPALSDLFLSANPVDSKADWQNVVPELEHVGLAKREAHDGEGLGGCVGRECGRRFYKDRHHDDHHHHHEHEDEGYEEHYWVEHKDHHHHDSHNHHHHHDHFDHYNRFNDSRDHFHHHHNKADKRSLPVALPTPVSEEVNEGDAKLAHGGGRPPFLKEDNHFKERIHDFKDHHRSHRHHDHHDDVEYYREEIIDHDDRHHNGHHHSDQFHHHHHRPFHHHHHHKDKAAKTERRAVEAGDVDFHQGLTDKHICQYFRGVSYKAHELQRSVEQFQYENVPWLSHNQGPWQHVLDGMRQIEWVLTKLGNDLKHTSGFTKKEERDLVGCYYSFAGISAPNGEEGQPFKKLLCLLAGRSKFAKHEPYAQKRVYNVVKNLEKAYLSTGEQLARVVQDKKYKANILWDTESVGGVRNYFQQTLFAYDVERRY